MTSPAPFSDDEVEQLRALRERAEMVLDEAPTWYRAQDLGEDHDFDHVEARFIAAADPSTILALLGDLEVLRRALVLIEAKCATENESAVSRIISVYDFARTALEGEARG